MDYLFLKHLHQAAVTLSITGFFLRGAGSLAGAAWASSRLAKTVPHVVDSVLLLAALMMVGLARIPLGDSPWLVAKLIGLLAYIGLGVIALRPGRPLAVRASAWVAALATVGWMVSVAITKDPAGLFRAWLS